jgi:hypothetical protein
LFAWPIKPTMTPMVLASAYLGGAYFFVRVLSERHWNAIQAGFVSVTVFATLLGVATAIHWNKFNHHFLDLGSSCIHDAVPGRWRMAGEPADREQLPLLRSFALDRWFSGLSG